MQNPHGSVMEGPVAGLTIVEDEATTWNQPDEILSNVASESDLHDTSAKSSNTLNTSNRSNIEHVITLTDIMKAINICNSSVNSLSRNLEGMREDINLIRQDMHTFKERMSGAKERISTLEDSLQIVMKLRKWYNNYLYTETCHWNL